MLLIAGVAFGIMIITGYFGIVSELRNMEQEIEFLAEVIEDGIKRED